MKANSTIKFIFSFVLVFSAFALSAQKFAYVDSKYILSHMPEYVAAQKQINELSAEWQAQVEQKYVAIEQLEKSFQAEKILLTEEMRQILTNVVKMRSNTKNRSSVLKVIYSRSVKSLLHLSKSKFFRL